MTIASPSMSTNAVIMRTVSFPLIALLPRYQRRGDISNSCKRLGRDLVHRVVRCVVGRIREIDDVDHAKAGLQQWNVIVCDLSATLLHEDVSVSEISGGLPNPR